MSKVKSRDLSLEVSPFTMPNTQQARAHVLSVHDHSPKVTRPWWAACWRPGVSCRSGLLNKLRLEPFMMKIHQVTRSLSQPPSDWLESLFSTLWRHAHCHWRAILRKLPGLYIYSGSRNKRNPQRMANSRGPTKTEDCDNCRQFSTC